MELRKQGAFFFIPDGLSVVPTIGRTTHMAIAAHPDDLEIMAYNGIQQCFGIPDKWFFGVVVTNGAGSARNGIYQNYSDEEMQCVRKTEQKKAACIGEYGALAMLDYSSSETKETAKKEIITELSELIRLSNPQVLYIHNLADKHDTHVSVAVESVMAVRKLPVNQRPEKLYGCEVWRSLDWLMDDDKILFDEGSHPNIASALIEVFDSQICGGKRYDLAIKGRRCANATYHSSHDVDAYKSLSFGMDLTPLIKDDKMDIHTYVLDYIKRFSKDVEEKIKKASKDLL